MSFLSDLLGRGNSNPANVAMPYLDQIPDLLHQGYDPYVQQGQQAYNQSNPIYSQMAQNPASMLESWQKQYSQSPGYQLMRDEALRAASNTAAARGMRGSFQDTAEQGRLAAVLQNAGLQDWIKNLSGAQSAGLSGLNNFYNTGWGATQNLTSDLSNLGSTKAGLSFQGQSQQNKSAQDIISAILSLFAQGGGAAAGAASGMSGGAGGAFI